MAVLNEDSSFSLETGKLMAEIFRPGTNYISQGLRGGGKTHTSVAFSWALVNGLWKEVGRVILLTNIIFIKRIKKSPGNPKTDYIDTEYPPGVYHVVTMEETFRTLSRLMIENPKRDVTYLILLDEAQNFFNSYDSHSSMSKTLQKWFGTLRKFDACLWMMTPSIRNVPPKGRSFNDDPNSPGYLNGIWSKTNSIGKYMKKNNIEGNPKEWVSLQVSHDDAARRFFRVPVTPWNVPYDKLEVGEFAYDHLSSADFTMGSSNFNFEALITEISNTASLWMSDSMQKFFINLDLGLETKEDSVNRKAALDKFLMIKEMDKLGLSVRKQAQIFSTPLSTYHKQKQSLYDIFSEHYVADHEWDSINKNRARGRKSAVKKDNDSSNMDKLSENRDLDCTSDEMFNVHEQNGSALQYISFNRSEQIEENCSKESFLGVPNGIYTLDELKQAEKYGLLEDE